MDGDKGWKVGDVKRMYSNTSYSAKRIDTLIYTFKTRLGVRLVTNLPILMS